MVDHDILLQRLKKMFCFSGLLLKWICSYVSNGKHDVYLNGKTNVGRPVICGVPQESVLCPLLFTLLMADIDEIILLHELKHHSYAEDNQVCASCPPSDASVLREKVLECIDSIQRRMACNHLMLNQTKSEFIWCASPQHVHLIDKSYFILKDGRVAVSTIVMNLSTFIDESVFMNDYIHWLLGHVSTNCVI